MKNSPNGANVSLNNSNYYFSDLVVWFVFDDIVVNFQPPFTAENRKKTIDKVRATAVHTHLI